MTHTGGRWEGMRYVGGQYTDSWNSKSMYVLREKGKISLKGRSGHAS